MDAIQPGPLFCAPLNPIAKATIVVNWSDPHRLESAALAPSPAAPYNLDINPGLWLHDHIPDKHA